jgi:hypothetical protein
VARANPRGLKRIAADGGFVSRGRVCFEMGNEKASCGMKQEDFQLNKCVRNGDPVKQNQKTPARPRAGSAAESLTTNLIGDWLVLLQI